MQQPLSRLQFPRVSTAAKLAIFTLPLIHCAAAQSSFNENGQIVSGACAALSSFASLAFSPAERGPPADVRVLTHLVSFGSAVAFAYFASQSLLRNRRLIYLLISILPAAVFIFTVAMVSTNATENLQSGCGIVVIASFFATFVLFDWLQQSRTPLVVRFNPHTGSLAPQVPQGGPRQQQQRHHHA